VEGTLGFVTQRQLGNITIDRIIELEAPLARPIEFFDEAVPEAVEPHRYWLEPKALDPASGRMILPVQSYLVRTRHHTILIDTCVGCRKSNDEFPDWYDRRDETWLRNLEAAGVGPGDIDYVFCTHLHLDHCGWNTQLIDGRWVPTFPNATYLFGREECEFWQDDEEANHRSWEDSVQPVFEAKQGKIVDSNHEIEPGVSLVPAFGHSPGHIMLKLDDGKTKAYVIGDVIHHPVQVEHPAWSSQFCWDADKASAMRTNILEQVADTDQWLIPAHFPTPTAVRVTSDKDGFWLAEKS